MHTLFTAVNGISVDCAYGEVYSIQRDNSDSLRLNNDNVNVDNDNNNKCTNSVKCIYNHNGWMRPLISAHNLLFVDIRLVHD